MGYDDRKLTFVSDNEGPEVCGLETDTKTKVLKAFEEEYPADLSIKEAAVNAGVRSGTPSTYIKVLVS